MQLHCYARRSRTLFKYKALFPVYKTDLDVDIIYDIFNYLITYIVSN